MTPCLYPSQAHHPVVLLHGNLGGAEDWAGCLSAWGGTGLDCRAADLWSLPKSARRSLETAGLALTETAPQGAILVGYSLGGRLALHAFAAEPQKWRALILLSVHPGLKHEKERARRLAVDRIWASRCLRLAPADFITLWNRQPALRNSGAGPRPHYNPRMVAPAFDAWSLGRQRDFRPLLHSLPVPLLWLVGERDEKFRALARECRPDAAVEVPGAGHRLLEESPARTAQLIAEFILSISCSKN